MMNTKNETAQDRRIKTLQRRCDKLTASCEALRTEKVALENELEVCKAKLVCVKRAKDEFMKEIEQTKQIRERYERAYNDLKIIKAKYSEEVGKLIKMIKY